jgi:opacity protein-like surface antigen
MKLPAAVSALALVAVSSVAGAQSGGWWIGAGMLNPTGDAADAFKSGLGGTAGILWDLKNNWSFQVEGTMSSNSAKTGSADMSLLALMGNLGYDWNPAEKVHPYAWGGLGFASSKVDVAGAKSETDMAWQVGAGLSWKASETMNVWADVKMLSVMSDPSTNFMGLTAGISMPWGKKK